ncbi:MAG: hypothetical protein V7K69_19825 [Nostoc sp.]|uniref:hypothetical protein n=1 Tax=Nostoc sp. TaxID=1180 RepID=UPI002FFBAF8E
MRISPPHYYLDDLVQIGDCAVALGFDPMPNHWTNAQDKQFAIRNSQLRFVIASLRASGDLDPNTKQATHRGWGFKPLLVG